MPVSTSGVDGATKSSHWRDTHDDRSSTAALVRRSPAPSRTSSPPKGTSTTIAHAAISAGMRARAAAARTPAGIRRAASTHCASAATRTSATSRTKYASPCDSCAPPVRGPSTSAGYERSASSATPTAAPTTSRLAKSVPRWRDSASSAKTPAISDSHAPRDSDRYIATSSSTAAPAPSARSTRAARGSAARPIASTPPIVASAPNAFQ